jgi:hypothetical protein
MNTKYLVKLSDEQRQHLEKLTSSGTVPARQMKRALILLKSDLQTNWSYEQIAASFDVSAVTIAKVRKTFIEWATVMKRVADEFYPQAEKIVVVLDNLNTHTPSAFYETFAPEDARRLAERFEFHFTPKHGSWLNMAEIELSALVRQCLDRRLPDLEILKQEVQAWQQQRNDEVVKAQWQFKTSDARTKLKHLYPKIQV